VNRFFQVLLIVTFLPLCWLGMMAVHELGHVAAAIASGGSVTKVVLHPMTLSRTDVGLNPHPRFVVWAGPIVGVAIPLALWGLGRLANLRWRYLLRFFAGFCLIANGAYIGVGSFDRAGDAGDMLRGGSPAWPLWLFGLAAVPIGLMLWNGLGRYFGLGKAPEKVDRRDACAAACLLAVVLLAEFALSSRY